MRILQVAPRFFPDVGGVENYVYYLSRELVRLGNQVTVICANESRTKKEEAIGSIKVKRLGFLMKIANTNITLTLPAQLLREDYDIIHAHLPDPWSATISAFISLLKRKPLVLTYHNDIVGGGINHFIARSYNCLFLPFVLGLAKKIIITHKEYLAYSAYLKKYQHKVESIPLGVDDQLFQVAKDKKNQGKMILFLGILDEYHRYKGLDYLIRAMPKIIEKIPQARLIVGGDGILKDHYKALVHSLKLGEQISFAGFISREKLAEFYSQADIFVLPSFSAAQEGFGIVLLEAMAAAKPVVTTEIVGTAAEIQEKMAGRVVKSRDEKELARAIIEILGDERLARLMGENGRRLVKEFHDWSVIAGKILSFYKNASLILSQG